MRSPSRRTDHPRSAAGEQHIVSIASGKGGVGKTWLAITLSHALARMGTRTLLFDGDLGLANVDVQLNLDLRHDIADAVEGRIEIEEAITHYAEGSFDVVAGKSGSGALADLGTDAVANLGRALGRIAGRYQWVVLDLGAGIDGPARALIQGGGPLLAIVTDEPTSLTDAYALIKLTLRDDPKASIRVVVNMAETTRSGERTYAALANACHNFLAITPPLLGVVRRDPKVREAIRHQAPLFTRYPVSEAAGDVERLATALVETMQPGRS